MYKKTVFYVNFNFNIDQAVFRIINRKTHKTPILADSFYNSSATKIKAFVYINVFFTDLNYNSIYIYIFTNIFNVLQIWTTVEHTILVWTEESAVILKLTSFIVGVLKVTVGTDAKIPYTLAYRAHVKTVASVKTMKLTNSPVRALLAGLVLLVKKVNYISCV